MGDVQPNTRVGTHVSICVLLTASHPRPVHSLTDLHLTHSKRYNNKQSLNARPSLPSPSHIGARPLVPRTPICAAPLQHLQVPAQGRSSTRPSVPTTAVTPAPLQYSQMSPSCRPLARPRIPRTTLSPCPLQNMKVPAQSRPTACFSSPGYVVSPSEYKGVQMSRPGCCAAG